MGFLCDRLAVNVVIAISTLGSCISVFIFWGLGSNVSMLVVFSLTYGFFAGGFSAIWAGMMKDIQRVERRASMGTLMGVFAAGRGIGAVASGPLSELLLKSSFGNAKGGGYLGEYGVVIVFTGFSMLMGSLALGSGSDLRKHRGFA
jgi:MFS family permease